jgi:hypothetical protein
MKSAKRKTSPEDVVLHRTNPRQGVQDEKHVEAELKQRKGS